jgi:tRNA(Ile)-lysidine synthase
MSALSPLARRVARSIRERRLLADDDRVAVAVSGGSDSVALTIVLAELARRANWQLAGLVHLNHSLRPEADADEAFVLELAARLSLPIECARVDVATVARDEGCSVEVAGRRARYRHFASAASRLGATVVATGHTMDDQAETVLMRLLRGASLRGVSAVRARRGIYVRPLLDCRRQELRDELAARGEAYRDDPSNESLVIARNRVRHRLVPVIEELAPGGVRALGRFADLAAEDEAELARHAAEVARAGVQVSGGEVRISLAELRGLAPAVARRLLRDAVERAGGSATARDVDAIRQLVTRVDGDAALDLHRIRVVRRGDRLVLSRPTASGGPRPFSALLPVPGRVDLPETGVRLRASFLEGADVHPIGDRGQWRVALQADRVHAPFMVRSRQPGDRLRPLGAPGSRSLQDLMIDRKIPRDERESVPIVVDREGRIVWVAGVAMAHDCRVTAPESGVVILELEKSHQ